MASDEAGPHKKRVLRVKRLPQPALPPGANAVTAPAPPPVTPQPPQSPPNTEPSAFTPEATGPATTPVKSETIVGDSAHDTADRIIQPHEPERAKPAEAEAEAVQTLPVAAAMRKTRRRGFMARAGHAIGALATFFLIVSGVICGAIAWQLSRGPIALDIMNDIVTKALETQFGDGFDVEVSHTDLRNTPEGLVLGIEGVTVRDPAGRLVVSSPEASIGIDPMSLLRGNFLPREIQFIGLAVAVTISPTGQLSVSTGSPDQPAAAPAAPSPQQAPANATEPSMAEQVLSLGVIADTVAGRTGPLAILDRAGIRQGRLTLTDMRRNRSVTYSDLSVNFTRPEGGDETQLAVSARGPHGIWSVSAAVIGKKGHNKRLRFNTRDLAISEFLGFAEPGLIPVHTDMPLSVELTADFAADNAIMAIDGQITGGRAVIEFADKAAKPLRLDQLQGAFSWDRERHQINLRNLELSGGGSRLRLSGTVTPPGDPSAPWVFRLSSQDSSLREESARNHQIELDSILIAGRIAQGFGGIRLDELSVTGPEVSINASLLVGKFDTRDGFELNLVARRMPALALLSFWPTFIVPDIRAYIMESVKGGHVDRFSYAINLTRKQFADAMATKPLPDDSVLMEIDANDISFIPQPGLPVFKSLESKSRVTGRTVTVTVMKGQIPFSGNRAITLGETVFRIADVNALPPQPQITSKLKGGVDAFGELLKSELLKPYYHLPFDPSQVKGTMDAQLLLSFPLVEKPAPDQVSVTASGTISNLTVDRIIGRDKLENGQFTFLHDKAGMVVKGDARIGGMPSSLELRHPAGVAYPNVNLTGSIDEAARARRGFKFGNQLVGPVGVKAVAREFGGPKQVTNVEIDLTRAGINGVIPGWVKPAGRAGKATFRLSSGPGDTMIFEELNLDGGNGMAAKGDVTLGPDGQLNAAKLSTLKISPGDSMTLDAERKDNVLKLTIRASTIDLRPELKTSFAPTPAGPASPGNADIDLDLKATAALGFNNETLTGLDMKISQRDGAWRDLKLNGKIGRSSVIGQNARNEQNQPVIAVETNDAGALLRYMDLYKRMIGGNMLLQFSGKSEAMAGSLVVQNFALRDDPALANVAATSRAAGRQTITDPGEVAFTKMRADFVFDSGRMTLKDATLSGPQVGGTVEGTLDFQKDRADLSGTFVPAYGLNNAFNQIPLVGQLLGGKDEGLFAINFRVTGALSAPTVTVNPLSAVAPGFLRKFFGVWGSDDKAAPAPKPAQ